MSGAIIRQHGRFVEATIDGETVLMEIDSGRFFKLAGTGAAIWNLIDDHRDLASIAADLQATFDGPRDAIARDLASFVIQLREAGLVA